MADNSALNALQPSQPYSTGAYASPDIPAALQQIYQQGFGMLGQQLATPYTTYQNPRIADLTDLQKQAMSSAGGLSGLVGNAYQQAQSALSNVPTVSAGNISAPSVGGNVDLSKITSYTPNIDPSKMNLSTGAWTDPNIAASYMSPYTTGVVNRIAELGNRNLTENILPGVNSTFTGAGQFGSTRNAEFENRAIRDAQDAILGAQANALEQGYTTAGNLYGSDAARALQAQQGTASNLLGAGNLGLSANTADNQAYLQGAGINANLAQTQAQLQAQAAQQNAANALQAQLANQTAAQNRANQYMNLGAGMTSNLGSIANLQNTLGTNQQNLNQQNLNLAYQDYLQQQQYPMTNLQNVMSVANPIANAVTGKNVASSYITPGVTGTQQVVGGLGALGQLASSGALNTIGSGLGSLASNISNLWS